MEIITRLIFRYNSALRKISSALVIRGIGLIFSLLVTYFLLIILDVRSLGIFYFIVSLSRLASILFSMGVFASIIPQYSSYSNEKKNSLLNLSIVPAIALSLFVLFIINLTFFFLDSNLKTIYWYIPHCSILISTYLIQFNLYNYFNCKERLALTSFMLEGNGRNYFFLPILFVFHYFFLEETNLNMVLSIFVVSSILVNVFGLINYSYDGIIENLNFNNLKDFFRVGFKFFPSIIVSTGAPSIYDVLINVFFGPITLAVIGVANRVVSPLMIHNDLIVLNYVKASRYYLKGSIFEANSLHIRSLIVSFSIALVLMILFYLFGYEIISTFMEFEKLPNIKDVIFIFFISTLTQSACNFSLHFLRNIGDYLSMTFIELISLTVTIICMFSFLELGIYGAALASMLGRLMMMLVGFGYAKYSYDIPFLKARKS